LPCLRFVERFQVKKDVLSRFHCFNSFFYKKLAEQCNNAFDIDEEEMCGG
jgi:Ulp1 family protease